VIWSLFSALLKGNLAPKAFAHTGDQLAQLTHTMTCIDQDNWMTDVLYFKTSMFSREMEKGSPVPPLKHYAAVV
jgi:hypothetical protein